MLESVDGKMTTSWFSLKQGAALFTRMQTIILRCAAVTVIGLGCTVPAGASTVFPQTYHAAHTDLVQRTARLALVRADKVELSGNGCAGIVTFTVIELFKGRFVSCLKTKFQTAGHNVTANETSGSDARGASGFRSSHRDLRRALRRSRGVTPDCVLNYHFEEGGTYLGFFEGAESQHSLGFELIESQHDAWLAWVRNPTQKQN